MPRALTICFAMKFFRRRIMMELEVLPSPKNIKKDVAKKLETFLLKYSSKIGGILLTFSILGTTNEYRILYDNPMLTGRFLIDCVVFELKNDVVEIVDGYALGIFYVGDCRYFRITGMCQDKGIAELTGEKLG